MLDRDSKTENILIFLKRAKTILTCGRQRQWATETFERAKNRGTGTAENVPAWRSRASRHLVSELNRWKMDIALKTLRMIHVTFELSRSNGCRSVSGSFGLPAACLFHQLVRHRLSCSLRPLFIALPHLGSALWIFLWHPLWTWFGPFHLPAALPPTPASLLIFTISFWIFCVSTEGILA